MIVLAFFGTSCQKDLVLDSQINQFTTGNQFLKSETLANGVHKTTLENGIQIYQIPQELMPKLPENSPLGCGNNLPSNAEGCCCLDFLFFGNAVNGQISIPNSFVFSEQAFVLPDSVTRAFYIKIKTVYEGTVFYEGTLPWPDPSPSCNTRFMAVIFSEFPFCGGDVEVTGRKLFRNPSDPSFTICAETIEIFNHVPDDTGAHCFF